MCRIPGLPPASSGSSQASCLGLATPDDALSSNVVAEADTQLDVARQKFPIHFVGRRRSSSSRGVPIPARSRSLGRSGLLTGQGGRVADDDEGGPGELFDPSAVQDLDPTAWILKLAVTLPLVT